MDRQSQMGRWGSGFCRMEQAPWGSTRRALPTWTLAASARFVGWCLLAGPGPRALIFSSRSGNRARRPRGATVLAHVGLTAPTRHSYRAGAALPDSGHAHAAGHNRGRLLDAAPIPDGPLSPQTIVRSAFLDVGSQDAETASQSISRSRALALALVLALATLRRRLLEVSILPAASIAIAVPPRDLTALLPARPTDPTHAVTRRGTAPASRRRSHAVYLA